MVGASAGEEVSNEGASLSNPLFVAALRDERFAVRGRGVKGGVFVKGLGGRLVRDAGTLGNGFEAVAVLLCGGWGGQGLLRSFVQRSASFVVRYFALTAIGEKGKDRSDLFS